MICFGFRSLDFVSNFWSRNIRRDFSFFKDTLNQSDFCDERLRYRGFYRKNNLKSEYTYYSSMFVVM